MYVHIYMECNVNVPKKASIKGLKSENWGGGGGSRQGRRAGWVIQG